MIRENEENKKGRPTPLGKRILPSFTFLKNNWPLSEEVKYLKDYLADVRMSDFLPSLPSSLSLLWNVSGRLPYQKVVDVIVVGRVAFSFPLAVVSVADLSRQKIPKERQQQQLLGVSSFAFVANLLK